MLRIAIDFDGTIVENAYPAIGKPLLFAFETLRELQKRGFILILWTVRTDNLLEEAVEFCRKNGLEFYAVNNNYPEEQFDQTSPRKLDVDIFIDDRNFGGFPGWGAIIEALISDKTELNQKKLLKKYRQPNRIQRFFRTKK